MQSTSSTANQRHRAARRALGYKETTMWISSELDDAINRYVRENRATSRRDVVTEALEARFMPERERS
jgi:hypothetical protein